MHQNYFDIMNIDEPRDWNILSKEFVDKISDLKHILTVKAGDLVIWDSRTFHQNTCGDENCVEERLVQYLYLPKYNEKNNEKEKTKKKFL